jgi:hypothetical protein
MAELAAVYDAAPPPARQLTSSACPGRRYPLAGPDRAAKGKWLTASVTDDIAAVIAAGF